MPPPYAGPNGNGIGRPPSAPVGNQRRLSPYNGGSPRSLSPALPERAPGHMSDPMLPLGPPRNGDGPPTGIGFPGMGFPGMGPPPVGFPPQGPFGGPPRGPMPPNGMLPPRMQTAPGGFGPQFGQQPMRQPSPGPPGFYQGRPGPPGPPFGGGPPPGFYPPRLMTGGPPRQGPPGGSVDDHSPPGSPTSSGPVTSTISAQMRCKVFLKQQHQQWKSLGPARLKLYHTQPTNIKQLVVEAETKEKTLLISTIILSDGVERVGKTGVAIELSDQGQRTGIVYMLQLRNEQSTQGLFDSLLSGSDRTVAAKRA